MTVRWQEDLESGLTGVDEQHRELFRRIESLGEAVDAGRGPEELMPMLRFLDRFALVHFRTEERAFERCGYPHAEMHREEHLRFLSDLEGVSRRIAGDPADTGGTKIILNTLFRYIVQHVGRADAAFAVFVRGPRGDSAPSGPIPGTA